MSRVDPDGNKDHIYWMQSFNYRQARRGFRPVEAAVARRNYSITIDHFASKANILATMARADKTDFVVVNTHSSKFGMRESGIFGPKALITGTEMSKAVASDSSRPTVILAGCNTATTAQQVHTETGVTTVGTTARVGGSALIPATAGIIGGLIDGAPTADVERVANAELAKVTCTDDPCEGHYMIFSRTPDEEAVNPK